MDKKNELERVEGTEDTYAGAPFPLPLEAQKRLLELIYNRKSGIITRQEDRKSTRLNSSHVVISYAVFCLKKKKKI